jgi:hypothetical protein
LPWHHAHCESKTFLPAARSVAAVTGALAPRPCAAASAGAANNVLAIASAASVRPTRTSGMPDYRWIADGGLSPEKA